MKAELRERGTRRRAEAAANGHAPGELEQYRQLVQLQRQMIELARQNEKARRECDVLREKVALEIATSLSRRSLSFRMRQKARRILKRLQGLPAPANQTITLKEPLLC